jgi:histidine triad (HIT) family protein
MTNQACIFCKIAKKEIPSEIIFEDDLILAFKDINPQAPSHILVIPKEHYPSLNEIPEEKKEILSHILMNIKRIAQQTGASENGYRVVLNTGKNSGQEVFHVHFHLLSGRRMTWPPG